MKKIFTLIIFVGILLSSCDDNLDTTPGNKIPGDLPFKTIEGAQTVLTGTYDWFHKGNYAHYTDQYLFFMPDIMGEDVFVSQTGNYGRFVPVYQYSTTTSSTYALDPWANFYSLIDNANLIIANIESLPPSDERDRIQGEAHALRAFAYHYLIRLYAKPYNNAPNSPGVVLRIKSSYDGVPRSTVKDAYTLIEADLLKSISLLKNNPDKAYIDLRGAKAILARVYLDMGAEKRDEAITYAEDAANGITLMDSTSYVSAKFSDYNTETIWGYQATTDDNATYLSIQSFYYYASGGEYGEDGKTIKYKDVVEGYSSFRVSQNLVDLYESGDIRKNLFPLIDGTTDYLNRSGALVTTKFRGRNKSLGEGAINFIRGSEMYLIIAEAAADANDYTKARNALNKVRTARQLGNYTGADASLVDEIQLERRRELFGEGHRLFDIKRRGLGLSHSDNSNQLLQGHWAEVNIEPQGDRFELAIPQKEIDANKSLTENDQNPYYK